MTDDAPDLDAIGEMVDRHVAQLMEHCDGVRVFLTVKVRGADGPETAALSRGAGNFYAALGQVREWLVEQDHRARVHVEKADREGDDD